MSKYHKIRTVWLRNPEANYKTLLERQWSRPEFGYLADLEWVWTEKVDGMNVRVIWTPDDQVPTLAFGGKTDRATLPQPLSEHLQRSFTRSRMAEVFPDCAAPVVLYGEGYGGKIQKAGSRYGKDQRIILFDVRVDKWWLERDAVQEVASKLGVPVVPEVGRGPLLDAIEFARTRPTTTLGEGEAEGLVMRPAVGLADRAGRRVITKIKAKDF